MSCGGVYQCDICLKNISVRLIPLVKQEKSLALKLIKSSKNYRALLRPDIEVCVICFKKLFIFKQVLRRYLKLKKINGIMQEPEPSNKENVKEQSNLPTSEQVCLNDYTCKCENCENKYGSLPLLLQGIEQKSQTEKTDTRLDTESQPSTSSSQDNDSKTPKKLLVCDYCKKSFTHKGDYNKHLRKHTKEQPYSCSICKRKFAHTSNLQRHQRLHSGYRPFVCKSCNKSFSRKDKLQSHRKSKLCRKNVPQEK